MRLHGNKIRNGVCALSILALAQGCATNPNKLGSTYVSPVQYNSYNCDQILAERIRVERRVSELTGKQAKASKNDKVAMGVGLVLFWPALFFLAGGDHADELKRLKGEYEALEVAWIEKECDKELKAAQDNDETKSETPPEDVEEVVTPVEGDATSKPDSGA